LHVSVLHLYIVTQKTPAKPGVFFCISDYIAAGELFYLLSSAHSALLAL
jgi:hypothetical protein